MCCVCYYYYNDQWCNNTLSGREVVWRLTRHWQWSTGGRGRRVTLFRRNWIIQTQVSNEQYGNVAPASHNPPSSPLPPRTTVGPVFRMSLSHSGDGLCDVPPPPSRRLHIAHSRRLAATATRMAGPEHPVAHRCITTSHTHTSARADHKLSIFCTIQHTSSLKLTYNYKNTHHTHTNTRHTQHTHTYKLAHTHALCSQCTTRAHITIARRKRSTGE